MVELALPQNPSEIGSAIDELPNAQAVFLLWPRARKPELVRTNVLRKRLKRTLGELSGTIERVEYRLTGSRLASHFLMLELARRYLGAGYRREIRLRLPPFVKLILSNPFPRTQVTSHLGRAHAVYFGPFRNRSTATHFESEFLDLFQLRRCQEDLAPAPEHPGCIYGEMGKCLRPCQQAVSVREYGAETMRVSEFLETGGRSIIAVAQNARDHLSAEMDFEGAALMHQRLQRVEEVLAQRDELARAVDRLHAITVTKAAEPDAVELGWLREGSWQGFSRLEFHPADGASVSLDARIRELATSVPVRAAAGMERMEQLATLARWFYSGWCDGELLLVDDWEKIPYRKLVNAVSRVLQGRGNQEKKPRA